MNGKDKYRDFDGNGFDITQLQEWDQKHFMHPWAEMSSNKSKFDVITEGKGIYLYDSSGKKYIDGPGGMWCVNVGYGRKEIASAVSNQLVQLPYASPWTTTTEPSDFRENTWRFEQCVFLNLRLNCRRHCNSFRSFLQ